MRKKKIRCVLRPERLKAEFLTRPPDDLKLKKGERELLAFLELHPGQHNLGELRRNCESGQASRPAPWRGQTLIAPRARVRR